MSVKISDIEFLAERQVYSMSIPPISIPLKFFPVFYLLIKNKDELFRCLLPFLVTTISCVPSLANKTMFNSFKHNVKSKIENTSG